MGKDKKLFMMIGSVPPISKSVVVVAEVGNKDKFAKFEYKNEESPYVFKGLTGQQELSIKEQFEIEKCICYKRSKKHKCIIHQNPY